MKRFLRRSLKILTILFAIVGLLYVLDALTTAFVPAFARNKTFWLLDNLCYSHDDQTACQAALLLGQEIRNEDLGYRLKKVQ